MKKSHYEFSIKLEVQGPVLTKSTSPAGFGVDAAVARDFRTGRPSIPGTLIEGKLRESLCQLRETARLDEYFGKATAGETHNEPGRGRIVIGDLVATETGSQVGRLSRTALDPLLGSAKAEALRVVEMPFPPGRRVAFAGSAFLVTDAEEAAAVERLLRLGLLWMTQAGSLRTTGFGRVLDASVQAARLDGAATGDFSGTVSLELAIRPQGPLCISRHKIGGNLFESEDVIPGNLLAGAIMQTARELGLAGALREFDKIRFRHAFPAKGESRPRALPLSTVKAGNCLYDIAACREPVLLKSRDGGFAAPEFPVDWKQYDDAVGELGWAFPAREIRVRTAIDSESRTADRGENEEGGKLFAWEMVHPFESDKQTPVVWRSCIDLSALDDADAAAVVLGKVVSQLGFVSKTKARCEVGIVAKTRPAGVPELFRGQALALVLQTPALLMDPRFQDLDGVPKSGALSAKDTFALYRAAWSGPDMAGGSLDLSHHFAQQRLAGGNYLAIRFQKRHGKPYNPWLLTDAGSVFVFTVLDPAEAADRVAAWLAGGLPLPEWARRAFGDAWDHNPYLPQNGFGEVAIHQPKFPTPKFQPVVLADPILPAL